MYRGIASFYCVCKQLVARHGISQQQDDFYKTSTSAIEFVSKLQYCLFGSKF